MSRLLPLLTSICLLLVLIGAPPAMAQKEPDTSQVPAPEQPAEALGPTTGEAPISEVLSTLSARFEAGEATELAALLASAPEGVTAATIGHLLYARRHFDRAAWFFGTDVSADPTNVASMNNFAALLFELYQADPATADPSWLPLALRLAEQAAALSPDSAPVQNTLGNVARATGDLATAITAGERATILAPHETLYWTNLARSHAAAGAPEAAAAALARAHALDPNGAAVRLTAAALPAISGTYRSVLQSQCNVNFNCAQICPGGIIGGVMRVTCEIESSSAQLSCQQGEPYPTSYNCQEEFPEYGILIPGLNSGFSLSVPGFSMHVLVDGNGDVRVRLEGGLSQGRIGVYAGVDGTWSPSNGASFDEFRGGTRINVLPRALGGDGEVDRAAGAWGHPPAHIELEGNSSGEVTLGVESYNAGLLST